MSKFLTPLLLVFNIATFGQDVRTSTLSFGVGGLPHSGTFQKSGPTFTGNYEYRVSKYLAVEAGTDIFLPSYFTQKAVNFIDIPPGQNLVSVGQNLIGSVSTSEPSRIALLTYGFRGILGI